MQKNMELVDERYSWFAPAQLWKLAAPLVPAPVRRPQGGGSAPADSESVFAAIAFVVVTGSPWRELPRIFGVSWQTAHRRFGQWAESGLWWELLQAAARTGVRTVQYEWAEKLYRESGARGSFSVMR
ncbi:transposase [Streptomyces sp. NPDC059627]